MGSIPLLILLLLLTLNGFTQTVTPSASPSTVIAASLPETISLSASISGNRRFLSGTWTVNSSPANSITVGATSTSGNFNNNTISATATVPVGTPAGTYTFTLSYTRSNANNGSGSVAGTATTTVTVFIPNLYSASGTGTVKAYFIDQVSGAINNGPVDVFTPLANTAGLAKNKITASDAAGSLYYIQNSNSGSNNGVVNIYAANPDGSGNTSVGSVDMNGAGDNTGLGFVRLGFDQNGYGWVVAGGGGNLYIAKFLGNGTSAISNVNTFGNATLSITGGGSAADFQNGDLAFSANGTMYVLGNVTGSTTSIYTLNSSITPTTLTKKWTLVAPGSTPANPIFFSGSVNGVAFTKNGSMHISASDGLYFIDQTTATITPTGGQVTASLVQSTSGLTDLASDALPSQSSLPVKLSGFTISLADNISKLNWVTDFEESFDAFEVERSADAVHFSKIGVKKSNHTSGRSVYTFEDNLQSVSDNVLYYRLKMVDINGGFEYSKILNVRRDLKNLNGVIISPNPVRNGVATAKVSVLNKGNITIRILDMSGRMMLQQQNSVNVGINSIAVNNIDKLVPGSYILQVVNGADVSSTKISVGR